MTAPRPFSAVVRSSRPELNMDSGQMSFPKVLDPRGFRARFAFHWMRFLREYYRNPEEVAVAFGVRFQTALNWWNGVNRPSGDVVGFETRNFPGRLANFLEECE